MRLPLLLTTEQVCEWRGCSPKTVWEDVRRGKFPAPIKVGLNKNSNRWREADLLAWLEARPLAIYKLPPGATPAASEKKPPAASRKKRRYHKSRRVAKARAA